MLTTPRDKARIKHEIPAMRQRIREEHTEGAPLKHGPGGLLDIEFVVQLGLLLNANSYPEVIGSTEISRQLRALQTCGWINTNTFNTLDSAYTQLVQARQQTALIDDRAEFETTSLLNIAQALCDEILG